jgi:hypothetical protein
VPSILAAASEETNAGTPNVEVAAQVATGSGGADAGTLCSNPIGTSTASADVGVVGVAATAAVEVAEATTGTAEVVVAMLGIS